MAKDSYHNEDHENYSFHGKDRKPKELTDLLTEEEIEKLSAEERESLEAAIAEDNERQLKIDQMFCDLARTVEEKFSKTAADRTSIESRWYRAEELYLGSLAYGDWVSENDPLQQRRDGSHKSGPRFNLVRTKVDNTVAALVSSMFATGDNNWKLNPSPDSEVSPDIVEIAHQRAEQKLPPPDPQTGQPTGQLTPEMVQAEIQRIAQERCRGMESTIEDQLNSCSYGTQSREAMFDYVKLGTAVLKGPTNSAKMKKTYEVIVASDGTKVYVPKLSFEPRPGAYRVDPWLFYPSMTTNDPACIPESIEIHPSTERQLQDLKSNEGFFSDIIDECLREKPRSYNSYVKQSSLVASLTTNSDRLYKDRYILMEYHGPISRKTLDFLNVEYNDCVCGDSPDETLFGEIWVCNSKVIRLAVHSLEGQNEIPYAVVNYKKDPGSVFGFGLPDILAPHQVAVEKTYAMAMENAGLSALPITLINKALLSPAGQGQGYDLVPGKVFLANEYDTSADLGRAVQFVHIPTNTAEVTNVMNFIRSLAEEESNMPAIMAGMATPQAEGESATGIAVRGENATAPLFFQAQQWNDNITKKIISWMYDWNMQFNPNEWIKGDYEIDVVSTTQQIKQQKMRLDLQQLLMMAGQNPEVSLNVDMNAALRTLLSTMSLPEGAILSVEEAEAKRQIMEQNQQPDPQMLRAQAEMQNAETKRMEVENERARLQLEANELQQRIQMELLTKQESYETREKEAAIRLAEKQMDLQIEYLKLAQKDEQNRQGYVAKAQELQMKMALDAQKLGVQAQLKATDQALHAEEMRVRRDTGAGV
jgi:hypothetical protein